MRVVTAPVKINYTQAKAYCPISRLSGIKQCKFGDRNIKGETMGHVPTSITICLQTREVHRTAMHHAITDIQEALKNGKLHLSFPRY